MKVIIYSIPTVNGLISMEDEQDYSFISDKSWEFYLKEIKKVGVFIMGRRTYEVSLRTGAFPYDCLNVVMTKRKIENKWGNKVIFTNSTPKEVLRMLEKKGFDNVIVSGGHLSSSFMKEKLVDEIWIDLMPRAFTTGVRLFDGDYFNAELKLLKVNRFAENEVQVRYKVVKYH
ncbi:MAG: dihydrofolate reductase family protein [Candidatus Aenigmarchaeota archaeon]|nr:dihydrofolate reductase family protein [Candidatus Aenigmarchaeota archaeon]